MNSRDDALLAKSFLLGLEVQRLLLVNSQLAGEALDMEREIDLGLAEAAAARQACSEAREQALQLQRELAEQQAASAGRLQELRVAQQAELAALRRDCERSHAQELKALQDRLLRDLRAEVDQVRREEKAKYDAKLAEAPAELRPWQLPSEGRATLASPMEMSYTVDCLGTSEQDFAATGRSSVAGKYASLMVTSKRRSADIRSVGERSSVLGRQLFPQAAQGQPSRGRFR